MIKWGFGEAIQYYMAHPYPEFDYGTYVDKFKVKNFVKSVVSGTPNYVYFTTPEKIDWFNFEILPNQFMIKATHGCGWNIAVKDFSEADVPAICKEMKFWLQRTYQKGIERQYEQVTSGVLIEKYLGDVRARDKDSEFKFYVFNGQLEFIHSFPEQNYYVLTWNLLPMGRRFIGSGHVLEHKESDPKNKPKDLPRMIQVVEELVAMIGSPPFVRVDLYELDGVVSFGEFTFTPSCGNVEFIPKECDLAYGALLGEGKAQ